ncbi:unnamed protein product [Miscanthus lutarioriparius]|uniref:Uncharacterized protein n=1 Tax=Miscanthus lutarioriparius TaxID=422564 RepID=A0A811RSB5_9POAL|nr:unnamed protein product [Miscanthus lutarioriparius]
MQQVYVPKKVEALAVPPPRARPRSVITIGSMEAPVINHDGPIVIEEVSASKQDEAPKDVAGIEEKKRAEGDSKYWQPIWCPRGLNKTQRRKLQCAWHKQQKREKLAKMENEILNPVHVEIPPEGQNAGRGPVDEFPYMDLPQHFNPYKAFSSTVTSNLVLLMKQF